jgi:hypothetical protein
MTKNIPLFTFVFSAYEATRQYSRQNSSLYKDIEKLNSDNVRVLSEIRMKMKSLSYSRIDNELAPSNKSTAVTVLLVENESLDGLTIAQLAERENFEILRGRNVKEVESILNSRPDIRIIFVDTDMPAPTMMSKLVRTVGKLRPDVGIILASSHRVIRTFDLPRQFLFIKKPFDSHQVMAALRGLSNQVECSPIFLSASAPRASGDRAKGPAVGASKKKMISRAEDGGRPS